MRECDKCGKEIAEGFYNEICSEWYCSIDCMCDDNYTEDDYEEDCDNGVAYWTTCDEDEDEEV